MRKYCTLALLLVAIITLSSHSTVFGGNGMVMSGKVSLISQRITPESTIRILRINDTSFFVDESNVVIFGTVSPVNRYTFSAFNLKVGDNVTVIAEDMPKDSYTTIRVIIVLPAP